MKRILFVDDEPMVLDAIRASMRRQRNVWDMDFAPSAEEALRRMRAKPFDVVVSDMRMPGMDGAALLAVVKNEFPATVRIVLSGHAERESIMQALPVCHQFLAKPCDGAMVKTVVDRASGLKDLLESEVLRRVVGSTERLPALPRIYVELCEAMDNPKCSARDVVRLVEQDPAMCAKVLQLVNSAYFGLPRRINGVEPAIVYLGLDLVRSLALSAHVFGSRHTPIIEGFSHAALQEHSLAVATLARRLAPDAQRREEAFTAGLLHDVGLVVLAIAAPQEVEWMLASHGTDTVPLRTREVEAFGVSHAEVGAYLLGLWGLPGPIVEAVAYHHVPGAIPPRGLDTLALVHVADALVEELVPVRPGGPNDELDEAFLAASGLSGELPRWRELAGAELAPRTARAVAR